MRPLVLGGNHARVDRAEPLIRDGRYQATGT